MTGIYMIKNLINGKRYIGKSKNIKRRWYEHKSSSSMQYSDLKHDIKKFGIEKFKLEILEECPGDRLDEREKFYISMLKPEYNIALGGQGSTGHKVSQETRKLLSQKAKKQWDDLPEYEKQIRIKNNLKRPALGHAVSQATREKLRKANLGKKQSQDTIEKRSRIMKTSMLGNTNGNKQVVRLDDGAIFDSIKQAAKETGIHPSGITSAIKGRQRTAGGYQWALVKCRD